MQNQSKIKINEIFSSVQGEGLYVGQKHLFIRFCNCNLNCNYCDTDYKEGVEYGFDDLFKIIEDSDCNTVALTGGEPLLAVDFLYDFFKKYNKLNKKIYLETNGTLYKNLEKIIDFVDIVASDIKLKSATGQDNRFLDNEKFLNIAHTKECFIKVVFNNSIKDDEIDFCTKIAKKHNIPLILQPQMPLDKNLDLTKIFNDFYLNYKNIRLIPQTHKFLMLH